ncbi:TonB-dependent siderophore receptor [Pokkaliibacter sp. CJK22405]|uniref:TonB-dependent siderophore receptor n=1 Tax=Pokkaliibacter sp. CJK22405 TaxID=3384615 RepID=UPI003984E6FB
MLKKPLFRPVPLLLFTASSPLWAAQASSTDSLDLGPLVLDTLVIQSDAVSTAGTTKSAAGDDSQSLTVEQVDKKAIEQRQARDLGDALETVTGLSKVGGTNSDYVSRGFNLTRDNMKMDGMNAWVLKDESIPLVLVDHVDVLKGTGSMFYGSQEAGGVINVVTKKPEAESYHEIDLQGGGWLSPSTSKGWGEKAASFDSTGSLNASSSLMYRVIGDYTDSQGFRDHEKRSGYFFAPMVTWAPDDKQSLTAQLELTKYHYNAPTGLVAPGSDIKRVATSTTNYLGPQNHATDEGTAFSLTYERELAAGWHNTTKWRSVWHKDARENYAISSVTDTASPQVRRYYRNLANQQTNHSLDSYFTGEVDTGSLRHRLTLGGTYASTENDFNRKGWGSVDSDLTVDVYNPGFSYIDPNSVSNGAGSHRLFSYDTYSLYAQDVIGVTDKLDIQLGGRYDWQHRELESKAYVNASGRSVSGSYAEADENYFTPTLGASYRFNTAWRAHASYSESYETSAVSTVDAAGNPFDPETGKQYETGLDWTPAEDWKTSLTLFQITKENVVVSNAAGDNEALGEVRSRGAELSVGWQPNLKWQLQAGYTLLHTKVLEGDADPATTEKGNEFINAPHQQLTLQANYQATDKLNLGALWLVQSQRYGSTDNELVLPGYGRIDLTANYQIDPKTSVAVSVKNLFDKGYFASADSETAVYAGEPRYVQARLKVAF